MRSARSTRQRPPAARSEIAFDLVNRCFIALVAAVCLYPVVYALSTSLSESQRLITEGNVMLLPRGWNVDAYAAIFADPLIVRYYANSALYAVASTACMLAVTSLMGYALSIRTFFARQPITVLLVITMFFGGGLIPYYLTVKSFGMINTIWVMILPAGINVWNIIIFKTFFQQNPAELRESAYIDGANDAVVLARIVLPLSLPLLATFSIFGIVGSWNDYFTPMIFLHDDNRQPVQTLLRRLLITMQMQEEMARFNNVGAAGQYKDLRVVKSAIVVATILPIALVYPFFQKYFAKGILVGSLKG